MSELLTKLQTCLTDEKSDIDKYDKLIAYMKEHNEEVYCSIICDIKKDEESHHKMLQYIIDKIK